MGPTALLAIEKLHLWQETVLIYVCFCVFYSRDEHESSVTAKEDLGQSQNRQIWYLGGMYCIIF